VVKGSYGDTDGQLITLLLGFRVNSAELQKGVYIVNVADIIEATIGGYVDNTVGVLSPFYYTHIIGVSVCQRTVKHFSLYDFPFHPTFKSGCYVTRKIHHSLKKSTNEIE
jgi:hypothetical protein